MKIKIYYTVEKEIEIDFDMPSEEEMEDGAICYRTVDNIEKKISNEEEYGDYVHVTGIEWSKTGYMLYED